MTIKYQFLLLLNRPSLRHVSKGIIGCKSFQFSKLLPKLGRDRKKSSPEIDLAIDLYVLKKILNFQSHYMMRLQHFDYDDHYKHIKQWLQTWL